MSTSSLNNLSSSYLQSIIGTALQGAGLSTSQTNSTSPLAQQPDNGQLSPFAQLLNTLQQLQQSNPTEYQQVTQQIATNLQTAAQTATTDGNTTAASQLTQLSNDFSQASQNGQLPNVQGLAQAVGGAHHHHGGHHHMHASSDSDSDSSSDNSSNSSSSSASTSLSQLLAAFQTNESQSNALNPLNIIESTLSAAGITGS
jgi:hypothetical protein